MTHHTRPLPAAWVGPSIASTAPAAALSGPSGPSQLSPPFTRPRVERTVSLATALTLSLALRYEAARLRRAEISALQPTLR